MKYIYWTGSDKPSVELRIPWKYFQLFGNEETLLLGELIGKALIQMQTRGKNE